MWLVWKIRVICVFWLVSFCLICLVKLVLFLIGKGEIGVVLELVFVFFRIRVRVVVVSSLVVVMMLSFVRYVWWWGDDNFIIDVEWFYVKFLG